jgi:hypothetical protein
MPEDDDYATELRGDAPPEHAQQFHQPVRRPKQQRKQQSAPNRFPHGPFPAMTKDTRFTYFIQVICGIAATLLTTGIVWIASISVSTARKVDVLTEKSVTVEKSVDRIDKRVERIEQRQTGQRVGNEQ